MEKYQHRVLTNMDSSGFGVRLDNRLSSYIPPHWHREAELLLFIEGRVICNIESTSLHFKRGDLFFINSLQVHETRCSREAEYLVVHIAPEQMCLFMPTFDQLSFRLSFQPEEQDKAPDPLDGPLCGTGEGISPVCGGSAAGSIFFPEPRGGGNKASAQRHAPAGAGDGVYQPSLCRGAFFG